MSMPSIRLKVIQGIRYRISLLRCEIRDLSVVAFSADSLKVAVPMKGIVVSPSPLHPVYIIRRIEDPRL